MFRYGRQVILSAPENLTVFLNLKTSLPAMRRFHTDTHRTQCCLEFRRHGNVSICVNKFLHFALKRYFITWRSNLTAV
jgi:hypothetical protein